MDWNAIKPELQKKLDPKHIKPRAANGPKGDYIEGWHAIDEANAIFGFGAWSYTITSLIKDACELGEDKWGKPQWQAAYTCVVRVTVGDVVREDVGFGSGFGKNIGDAVEGATKEAVTDGLKRCLRTFGNRFGLALYDKTRANVGTETTYLPPDIEPNLPDFVKWCRDQHGGGQGFAEYVAKTFIALWNKKPSEGQLRSAWDKNKASLEWLEEHDKAEYSHVVDGFENRMMALTGNYTTEAAE